MYNDFVIVGPAADPAGIKGCIAGFGKEKYGSALFFPDSTEWRAQRGQAAGP